MMSQVSGKNICHPPRKRVCPPQFWNYPGEKVSLTGMTVGGDDAKTERSGGRLCHRLYERLKAAPARNSD